MAYENSAMDTAARFGEIPFAEFTKDLITDTFQALLDAHLTQMEAYQEFVQVLAVSLSTYINNTINDYTLQDIQGFLAQLPLPSSDSTTEIVNALTAAAQTTGTYTPASTANVPSDVWTTLVNALAPIAQDAVNAAFGAPTSTGLALATLQAAPTTTPTQSFLHDTTKNYRILYQAIAATLASNKYALLQSMARLGMLRLVVSDGEIETRITFSTWEQHEDTTSTKSRERDVQAQRRGISGGLGFLLRGGRRNRRRTVTVNTAKTYHRDTSGTRVDIFGRVLVRFKSDYAPLGE